MNRFRYQLSTTMVAAFATLPVFAAAQQRIELMTNIAPKVFVNGSAVTFTDATPGLSNGLLLLPVRAVAQQLGYKVNWDSATNQVALGMNGSNVQFAALAKTYAFSGSAGDGRAERFAVANFANPPVSTLGPSQVIVIDDRAYMPYVQLANALNAVVEWDDATNTLTITSIQRPIATP